MIFKIIIFEIIWFWTFCKLNFCSGKEKSQNYLTTDSVKKHISALWENEKSILSKIFPAFMDAEKKGLDLLFFDIKIPQNNLRSVIPS